VIDILIIHSVTQSKVEEGDKTCRTRRHISSWKERNECLAGNKTVYLVHWHIVLDDPGAYVDSLGERERLKERRLKKS
jgi:hypothetical protein